MKLIDYFESLIFEVKDNPTLNSSANKSFIDKVILKIEKYQPKLQTSTSRSSLFKINTHEDRNKIKKDVESILNSLNIKNTHVYKGSVGQTEFADPNGYIYRISYKPVSGGMGETTINATITEVAPALAFMHNKTFTNPDDFLEFLLTINQNNDKGVFLNEKDAKNAIDTIQKFRSSSKFKEKMNAAIQVLKFLEEKNKEKKISKIYWGYRKKPTGVPDEHRGDLFIEFDDKKMIGVSLKAGDNGGKEPLLNTYVSNLLRGIKKEEDQ
jgi:hypothetical protein